MLNRAIDLALRINLWSPGFSPSSGGIGAFSREIAIAFQREGVQLRLFGKNDVVDRLNGTHVETFGRIAPAFRTLIFVGKLLARAFHNSSEVNFCAHVNFAPVAYFLKLTRGTPYIVAAHGVEIGPTLPRAARYALAHADRVVAVSNWTRERVLALGVDPDRIAVLGNTFDDTRFFVEEDSIQVRTRYRFYPSNPVIVTAGRLATHERYKGHDRLIAALPLIRKIFPGAQLVIVGEGDDLLRLRALATHHAVADGVTFTGYVPDTELPGIYRGANVFAMPSIGEGFGIVFLEAMACGIPVLGGDRDGSVDALANGELGLLVNPTDLVAIADGICALLNGKGPPLWFEKKDLHAAVESRFGRQTFRKELMAILADAEWWTSTNLSE